MKDGRTWPNEIWLASMADGLSVAWFTKKPDHPNFTSARRYVLAAEPSEGDEFTTCPECGKPNGSTPGCDLCVLFRHEAGNETREETP